MEESKETDIQIVDVEVDLPDDERRREESDYSTVVASADAVLGPGVFEGLLGILTKVKPETLDFLCSQFDCLAVIMSTVAPEVFLRRKAAKEAAAASEVEAPEVAAPEAAASSESEEEAAE